MKPVPLFELILDDFTRYYGGDIVNPKWRESPDKAILVFKVMLPSGDLLQLKGYEAYNFFIEARAYVVGGNGLRLTYMFVMGKKGGFVTSYRIALSDKGQKIGDTTCRIFPSDTEYDGKATTGWHKGAQEKI